MAAMAPCHSGLVATALLMVATLQGRGCATTGARDGGVRRNGWMVFVMENPMKNWMIWGTTILGRLHFAQKSNGWIAEIPQIYSFD